MKPSRCAIYTRKSTEEGLEQDFNSLDAQREACSAYVASQKGEGWLELPNRYDDGGFSGGNMDRRPFSRGAVFHLLRNRLYVGEIVHGDRVWPGLHPPILARPLFEAVQAALAKQVVPRQARARRSPAVLTGLISDAHGAPMSPVTASRGDGRWRYYVTASTQQGARRSDLPPGGLHRIAAAPVEKLVAETLRDLIGQPTAPWTELRPLVTRVQVHAERVAICLTIEAAARAVSPLPPVAADGSITLNVPVVLKQRSGRAWLESARPSAPRRRPDRISGIFRSCTAGSWSPRSSTPG